MNEIYTFKPQGVCSREVERLLNTIFTMSMPIMIKQ